MASAPQHADQLLSLARPLSDEAREALLFAWVDRCVRVHAATALDRAGHSVEAAELREVGQVRDRSDCVSVGKKLRWVSSRVRGGTEESGSVLACIYGLLVVVERYLQDERLGFEWTVIGLVTAARCAGVWDEEQALLAEVEAALRGRVLM